MSVIKFQPGKVLEFLQTIRLYVKVGMEVFYGMVLKSLDKSKASGHSGFKNYTIFQIRFIMCDEYACTVDVDMVTACGWYNRNDEGCP